MKQPYGRLLAGSLIALGMVATLRAGDWLVVNQHPIRSDAIIVLGGGPIERIQKGVSLYKKGYAPWIIVSGGAPGLPFETQAEVMSQQAMEMGVPQSAILLENHSWTTYQNALYTERIMQARHFTSALVVSSNFHMRRVSVVFSLVYRKSGIRLRFISSPDPQFHPAHWWSTPSSRYLLASELFLIPINIVQGIFHTKPHVGGDFT